MSDAMLLHLLYLAVWLLLLWRGGDADFLKRWPTMAEYGMFEFPATQHVGQCLECQEQMFCKRQPRGHSVVPRGKSQSSLWKHHGQYVIIALVDLAMMTQMERLVHWPLNASLVKRILFWSHRVQLIVWFVAAGVSVLLHESGATQHEKMNVWSVIMTSCEDLIVQSLSFYVFLMFISSAFVGPIVSWGIYSRIEKVSINNRREEKFCCPWKNFR